MVLPLYFYYKTILAQGSQPFNLMFPFIFQVRYNIILLRPFLEKDIYTNKNSKKIFLFGKFSRGGNRGSILSNEFIFIIDVLVPGYTIRSSKMQRMKLPTDWCGIGHNILYNDIQLLTILINKYTHVHTDFLERMARKILAYTYRFGNDLLQ